MKQTTVQWPQYLAGLAASGGAFVFGAGAGWSSPASSRMINEVQYFPITQSEFDWAVSIFTLGAAFSCMPIGYLMKKFGRKWTMLGFVIPFMIGWILVTTAVNLAMLLAGRFFIGLAGGAFAVSSPQYGTEIAEKECRGAIGCFFQLLFIAGILFTYVVGFFLPIFWTNIICTILPLIFGLCFFFMPESPVYLILERRDEEAKCALQWLRGKSYDPQPEIDELKEELLEVKKVSMKEEFKKRSSVYGIIIAAGLIKFEQVSAIDIVLFYVSVIFDAANTGLTSEMSSIIVGTVHVLATLASTILVDRLGRKVLLMFSSVLITVTLASLGAFFFIQDMDPEMAKSIGWLPLTSLCIYIIAYAFGFGPIPWLIISEVLSNDINDIIAPICGVYSWGFAFAILLSFTPITEAIGLGVFFWIFTGLSALGPFFVAFIVPETKGKTTHEIHKLLNNEKKE